MNLSPRTRLTAYSYAQTGLENTNAEGGLNSRLCNADGSLAPMGRAWLMGSSADCGAAPPPLSLIHI